ncbi:ABC transporter substrate-binding protein [Nonomuraea roseoviolacea subsp. roseoviolacea]|uniref:Peptide/nickel transport system substrate-binding protein/oligopeptide transport system substrate-binding protein n=1 Tax=Nonomuraea roseoviolacea subsp. carminata TaxID=160689 RepID=A0ABT1K1V5_9ACTN|nr:ABC transporter substrate-binding protein [Nonomuraea roseoviolacea]MCP2347986.1 peptide/nickel transport system substrate-binding protein/oligopeptide transport system substrate-binding protein [Nonomuraea roseoviolacea subsp. carminata]
MRVTKGAQIVAGTALLALAVAACGGGGGTSTGTSGSGGDTPVRMELGEPQNLLVPSNTTESEGAEALAAVFEPLVNYDENKQVVMGAADSIETKDNKVWTIKLKPGYTWHNGEPVVAQNYVDAWNYAANQENAQGAGYFFGRVEGYADLNPGEGKPVTTKEMKGLKAVDDTTLEVTLSAPFSQFKTMLGYTAFYPLPKAAFGSDGKVTNEYGEKPIGQGLFKLDKPYKKGTDQTIDLTVYDKFPGKKPTGWTKLQFKLYNSSETAYNDLQADNVDIHDSLPASAIASAKTALGDRYQDQPDAGIGYIGFPLQYNDEYKDVKVREAISMAIDRKTIAETVFSGTRAPADDFINPAIDGYRQGACTACAYDPGKAKEQYAAAKGPAKLELGYNADGGHKEWIEAVANNLRANLGVEVTVKPFEKFANILDDLDAKKYKGMFRMGWAIDYPSAEDYLTPIFSTGAIKTGSNYAGYSNKTFDETVAKGDQAASPEESLKQYQAADDILIKEMPYIPVYFYRNNSGYSTKVKNVKINLLNQVEWADVEKA